MTASAYVYRIHPYTYIFCGAIAKEDAELPLLCIWPISTTVLIIYQSYLHDGIYVTEIMKRQDFEAHCFQLSANHEAAKNEKLTEMFSLPFTFVGIIYCITTTICSHNY